jgi:mRNA interferase MazF
MVNRSARPARGQIWLADLHPTRGSEQSGIRPVLIFSSDRFQQGQNRLVIVLPMTSRIKNYPFHLTVQPAGSGLDKPGAIMIDQVRVVATERLLNGRPIGQITETTMTNVEELFRVLFDLP